MARIDSHHKRRFERLSAELAALIGEQAVQESVQALHAMKTVQLCEVVHHLQIAKDALQAARKPETELPLQ